MDWSYTYSKTYLEDKDLNQIWIRLVLCIFNDSCLGDTKIWSTRGINRFRGARFVDADCQYEKEQKEARHVTLLLSDG